MYLVRNTDISPPPFRPRHFTIVVAIFFILVPATRIYIPCIFCGYIFYPGGQPPEYIYHVFFVAIFFTIVVAIFFILVPATRIYIPCIFCGYIFYPGGQPPEYIYHVFFVAIFFIIVVAIFFILVPATRIYIPCIFCGYIFYPGGQPPEYIYHVFFVAIFFILVASPQDMYIMHFLWLYFLFWWPALRIYIPCIFCGYIFYSGGQPPEYIYHVFFVAIFFLLVASLQNIYTMHFLWLYFLFWWPALRIYIPCIFCGYIFSSGGQPPEYIYHVFFVAIFFLLVASHQLLKFIILKF